MLQQSVLFWEQHRQREVFEGCRQCEGHLFQEELLIEKIRTKAYPSFQNSLSAAWKQLDTRERKTRRYKCGVLSADPLWETMWEFTSCLLFSLPVYNLGIFSLWAATSFATTCSLLER